MTLLMTLAAPAHADGVPGAVEEALQSALSVPEARIEVVDWKTSRACRAKSATIDRAVTGSGRYAVRLEGAGCAPWGWATVRIFATAFVTTRSVRMGETLDAAVKSVDQEVRPGRIPAPVSAGAKAARAIGAGQLIEAAHLEAAGAAAGAPIKIIVRSGSLSVSQYGRAVSCGRGRACAVLPSGKHVEGTLTEGALVVEVP